MATELADVMSRSVATATDGSGPAALRALKVIEVILRDYDIEAADAIDAARFLRSALHGFVMLELTGGFGIPEDVDRSFDRMIEGIATAYRHW